MVRPFEVPPLWQKKGREQTEQDGKLCKGPNGGMVHRARAYMHLWTFRAMAFSIVLDARAWPATWKEDGREKNEDQPLRDLAKGREEMSRRETCHLKNRCKILVMSRNASELAGKWADVHMNQQNKSPS